MLQIYVSTKCILTQVNMESQFMSFGGNSKINWLFKARVDLIMVQLYKVAIACKSIIATLIWGSVRQHGITVKYTATLCYSFFSLILWKFAFKE